MIKFIGKCLTFLLVWGLLLLVAVFLPLVVILGKEVEFKLKGRK